MVFGELAWLLFAQLFLSTPIGSHLISRHPERFRISWSAGWSFYPGHVVMRDLTLAGQQRQRQWEVRADRASAFVNLPALLFKRVPIHFLVATGVEASVGQAPGPPLEPRAPRRWPWRVSVPHGTVQELRQFAVGKLALTGVANGAASFELTIAGPLELRVSRFAMRDGVLTSRARPLARDLSAEGTARLGPYTPRLARGTAGFGFLDLDLTVRGKTLPIEPAAAGVATTTGVSSGGPSSVAGDLTMAAGDLALTLELERGQLAVGSTLTYRTRVTTDSTAPAATGTSDPTGGAATESFVDAVLEVVAGVSEANGKKQLELSAASPTLDLEIGPFALRSGPLRLTARSAETRLDRLLSRPASTPGDETGPPAKFELANLGRLHGELTATKLDATLALQGATTRLLTDRVVARLDLGALMDEALLIEHLRASGVDLAVTTTGEDGETPERRFALSLRDTAFEAVRSVSLDGLRLDGTITLALEGGYAPLAGLKVPRSELTLVDGTLTSQETVVASGLSLTTHLSLAPTDTSAEPKRVKAAPTSPEPGVADDETRRAARLETTRALLASLTGTVTAAGRVLSIGFLDRYLRASSWLDVNARGKLDLDLAIDHGHLLPGSHVDVAADPLTAQLFGTTTRGSARLRASVGSGRAPETRRSNCGSGPKTPAPSGPFGKLDLTFSNFAVVATDEPEATPYLVGTRQLCVGMETTDLDLGQPVDELAAWISLRGATAPDLRVFNRLLPKARGLALTAGHARVDLELALTSNAGTPASPGSTGGGSIRLVGEDVGFTFGGLNATTQLDLALQLADAELTERRFSLAGSVIEISDLGWNNGGDGAIDQGAGWWAKLQLPAGSLVWSRPLELAADLTWTARDTGPIVAFAAERRQLPEWIEKLLTVAEVSGSGRLAFERHRLVLDDVVVSGDDGRLELMTRVELGQDTRRSDLYVSIGALGLGIELIGEERDIRLLRPRAWYLARPRFLD